MGGNKIAAMNGKKKLYYITKQMSKTAWWVVHLLWGGHDGYNDVQFWASLVLWVWFFFLFCCCLWVVGAEKSAEAAATAVYFFFFLFLFVFLIACFTLSNVALSLAGFTMFSFRFSPSARDDRSRSMLAVMADVSLFWIRTLADFLEMSITGCEWVNEASFIYTQSNTVYHSLFACFDLATERASCFFWLAELRALLLSLPDGPCAILLFFFRVFVCVCFDWKHHLIEHHSHTSHTETLWETKAASATTIWSGAKRDRIVAFDFRGQSSSIYDSSGVWTQQLVRLHGDTLFPYFCRSRISHVIV